MGLVVVEIKAGLVALENFNLWIAGREAKRDDLNNLLVVACVGYQQKTDYSQYVVEYSRLRRRPGRQKHAAPAGKTYTTGLWLADTCSDTHADAAHACSMFASASSRLLRMFRPVFPSGTDRSVTDRA